MTMRSTCDAELVEQALHEVVGQRPRGGDALQRERDRLRLGLTDPDGQVALPLALLEQHDRLIGGQFDADADQVQLDHGGLPVPTRTGEATERHRRVPPGPTGQLAPPASRNPPRRGTGQQGVRILRAGDCPVHGDDVRKVPVPLVRGPARSRRRTRPDTRSPGTGSRGRGCGATAAVEQRAHLQRGRLAGPQRRQQVRQRQARVDDVLDHDHVPAPDVVVEVLQDPDDAG